MRRTNDLQQKIMRLLKKVHESGFIRFGLSSIKNFGDGISEAIIAERETHGSFKTLSDFLSRIGSKNLNRKSLESLIKCGALDSFSG